MIQITFSRSSAKEMCCSTPNSSLCNPSNQNSLNTTVICAGAGEQNIEYWQNTSVHLKSAVTVALVVIIVVVPMLQNIQEFTSCLHTDIARHATQILKVYITWYKISWDHFLGQFSSQVHLVCIWTCTMFELQKRSYGNRWTLKKRWWEVKTLNSRPLIGLCIDTQALIKACNLPQQLLTFQARKSPLKSNLLINPRHWPIFYTLMWQSIFYQHIFRFYYYKIWHSKSSHPWRRYQSTPK